MRERAEETEEIEEPRNRRRSYIVYYTLTLMATLCSTDQRARFYMLSREMATG